MRWGIGIVLLLSGCASDPIELNLAIGYQVSIVTAETDMRATQTGPTKARAAAYSIIAPGPGGEQ